MNWEGDDRLGGGPVSQGGRPTYARPAARCLDAWKGGRTGRHVQRAEAVRPSAKRTQARPPSYGQGTRNEKRMTAAGKGAGWIVQKPGVRSGDKGQGKFGETRGGKKGKSALLPAVSLPASVQEEWRRGCGPAPGADGRGERESVSRLDERSEARRVSGGSEATTIRPSGIAVRGPGRRTGRGKRRRGGARQGGASGSGSLVLRACGGRNTCR